MIGLLVWIDLVSRFLRVAAAWTATGQQPADAADCSDDTPEHGFTVGTDEKPPDEDAVVGPAPATPGPARRDPPRPAAVAGVLVGAGAAVGATAATAGRRYLRRKPKVPT